MSLYQLTIEPGTAFWDRQARGGLAGLPDHDLSADMFEVTQEVCSNAGMEAYEVSNHARPGSESRHNLTYWKYGDWVGVGPGAHGRLYAGSSMDRLSTVAFSAPGKWLESVEDGSGDEKVEGITTQDFVSEYLMMGLRIRDGVDLERFPAAPESAKILDRARELASDGLVWMDQSRMGVTERGRMVLNHVIAEIMPE
jgi:oxygen-independent coproporphyrinogen-3 oxidase